MELFQLSITETMKDLTRSSNEVSTKEYEKILMSPCKYETSMQPYDIGAKMGKERDKSIICKKFMNYVASKFNAIVDDLGSIGELVYCPPSGTEKTMRKPPI